MIGFRLARLLAATIQLKTQKRGGRGGKQWGTVKIYPNVRAPRIPLWGDFAERDGSNPASRLYKDALVILFDVTMPIHRHFLKLACGVLCMLAPIGAGAIDALQPPGYFARRWLVSEGLPHNIVRRSVQDKQGFLWIATMAGLARFDGHEFKLFRPPGSEEQFHYNIRDLAVEDERTVLMLPAVGGVIRLRDGVFSQHPISASLAGKTLLNLFVEPDGTTWVRADDGTLGRWQAGRCSLFGSADYEYDRNSNFTFARDGRGRVWIANGNFLGWYADGKIVRGPLPAEPGMLVAPSRSGGIWISTARRLLKLEGERLTVVCNEPDWLASRSGVSGLFEDTSNVLWIETHRHGLFRLDKNKPVRMLAFSELVTSVMEDSEKNIWVSLAGGGITRLRQKAFVVLGADAGLPDNVSLSICDDERGVLWCANRSSGLVRYIEGKAEPLKTSNEIQPYVTAVCPDKNGNIWAGAVEGLYRMAASSQEVLRQQPEVAGPIQTLYCARNGDLWIGSGNDRLGVLRAGKYQALSKNDGFPEERVDAIAEDARGTIWICTNRELFELVEGKFVRRLALEENHAGELLALHIDSRGSLWLGTTKGLMLRQSDQFKLIGTTDGLPSDTISQILEDDFGRLWCGGRSGLFSVALNDLYDVAAGRASHCGGITFGSDEGLPGTSSPTGRQPMAWKARDGRLWFASSEGLVGINPMAAVLERQPPPVFIDQVLIDNGMAVPGDRLVVPPGSRQVDFSMVALNYSAPEKVRLRHQLVGFDPAWVENGRERLASYVHLPPGNYQMRVIAANQDGVWTERGASLAVIVIPSWWQRWWFSAGVLICFTALIAGIVRYWSHRRLKRRLHNLQHEHTLDMERARIARDLHDELGGSLTQIRMLAERLKRHSATPEALSVAGQLAARTRRVTGELESIVWTVSPKNNTWDRLAVFLGQFSLRFFRDTAVACTVHGTDLIPALPLRPDQQHHVLAITKEALNNILKHAQASRVTITVRTTDEFFELEIADNGTGFDLQTSTQPTRNGLTNMRSRAHEIGGQLVIATAPGTPTKITLRVALPPHSAPPA